MSFFLRILNAEFTELDLRSRGLLARLDDDVVFQPVYSKDQAIERASCGEFIVRSAAMVEQTFGGLTTRLWDDPFEWTLPEKLINTAGITEYLNEVEATRVRGFSLFTSDDDLQRELPAPTKLVSVFQLLTQTLARANHLQGRAFSSFQILTGKKPPRL
jgi:hypothetical protein